MGRGASPFIRLVAPAMPSPMTIAAAPAVRAKATRRARRPLARVSSTSMATTGMVCPARPSCVRSLSSMLIAAPPHGTLRAAGGAAEEPGGCRI